MACGVDYFSKNVVVSVQKRKMSACQNCLWQALNPIMNACCSRSIVADEAFAGHVGRLLQSHDMEDGGSHVGQTTVLHCGRIVVGHIDERHGVERVSRVGRSIGVDGVVGITVVGDDNGLVVVGFGSLNHLLHAVVHCWIR